MDLNIPEQVRNIRDVRFGGFFLLQVIGYLGVRLGLWSQGIRGPVLLLAFAVGTIALVKYSPMFLLTRFRRRPERNSIDHHG